MTDLGVILKRFDDPDEVRAMTRGRLELVRVGEMTIGRATYQPGWRCSCDQSRPSGNWSDSAEPPGLFRNDW